MILGYEFSYRCGGVFRLTLIIYSFDFYGLALNSPSGVLFFDGKHDSLMGANSESGFAPGHRTEFTDNDYFGISCWFIGLVAFCTSGQTQKKDKAVDWKFLLIQGLLKSLSKTEW